MRNKAAYLALMAAAMMGAAGETRSYKIEPKETAEERKKRIQEANERINIQRGLKPFHYGEKVIWARDQKNADRKARNKGLI